MVINVKGSDYYDSYGNGRKTAMKNLLLLLKQKEVFHEMYGCTGCFKEFEEGEKAYATVVGSMKEIPY